MRPWTTANPAENRLPVEMINTRLAGTASAAWAELIAAKTTIMHSTPSHCAKWKVPMSLLSAWSIATGNLRLGPEKNQAVLATPDLSTRFAARELSPLLGLESRSAKIAAATSYV